MHAEEAAEAMHVQADRETLPDGSKMVPAGVTTLTVVLRNDSSAHVEALQASWLLLGRTLVLDWTPKQLEAVPMCSILRESEPAVYRQRPRMEAQVAMYFLLI